jgi:DNA-binding transcriptional ArsR family regulator
MVVDERRDEAVDELFHALADPTRRDILRRCAAGEPSVSRLAQAYPMSFAAVQKHVAVLERAGLVTKERRGREQLVQTDGGAGARPPPAPAEREATGRGGGQQVVHTEAGAAARARQALDELESTWRGRVDRMSNLLR